MIITDTIALENMKRQDREKDEFEARIEQTYQGLCEIGLPPEEAKSIIRVILYPDSTKDVPR